MRKLLQVCLLLLVAVTLTGCSLGSATKTESPPVSPIKVEIKNFAFNPSILEVKKGESVTFTNSDDSHHTATADNSSFDTGNLNRGDMKTILFNKPGDFDYHCTFHQGMRGKITVRE